MNKVIYLITFLFTLFQISSSKAETDTIKDYSIFIEKDNKTLLFVYNYSENTKLSDTSFPVEILDNDKFIYNRIAYINAENKVTPIFIQPSSLATEGNYKSLMQSEYQLNNVVFNFREYENYQVIGVKFYKPLSKNSITKIIDSYIENEQNFTISILSGGVYASGNFTPVKNIKQLYNLFDQNPKIICRLLSYKNLLNKTIRELKSDLNSLMKFEIKNCKEENFLINISSNKFLDSFYLNTIMCKKISKTEEIEKMVPFDLKDKDKYKVIRMSKDNMRFTFKRDKSYVLGELNRSNGKLKLLLFSDLNLKNIKSSEKYNCEKESRITERIVRKSETLNAWEVDGKFIIPECFIYEWLSSDNYEEFFQEYIKNDDISFQNFVAEIGTFLNKEVPLSHTLDPGWMDGETISLTQKTNSCLSIKPHNKVMNVTKFYFDDGTTGSEQSDIGYEILENYDLKISKKLAPHIKQKFDSIKKVKIIEWGGGSMGHQHHIVTYGVLNLNGEKVIVPLKNH